MSSKQDNARLLYTGIDGGFGLILETALALMLSTRRTDPKPPAPRLTPPAAVLGGTELANAIKNDIESLAGPGAVEVSVDHETLFSVRVAVPNFRSEFCTPIYDRELRLYRLFPDYSFDFYLRLKPAPNTRRAR
jgi:hypothetical protein